MGLKQEVNKAWDQVLSPFFEEFSAEILVESVDESATSVDPLYGEPVAQKVFTTPVAIFARVRIEKERVVLPGGEQIDIDGRLTVRSDELGAKGVSMEVGSRVTANGERFTVRRTQGRAQVGERSLLIRVLLVREVA